VTKTGNGSPNRDRNRKVFSLCSHRKTPRRQSGRTGASLGNPTPTALSPALQSEYLEALRLKHPRFFTYTPGSRSVLHMNSTKTAPVSPRLKSLFDPSVRSALTAVRGIKRRWHRVRCRPVPCGHSEWGATRIGRAWVEARGYQLRETPKKETAEKETPPDWPPVKVCRKRQFVPRTWTKYPPRPDTLGSKQLFLLFSGQESGIGLASVADR
jgi:hypothetical protein